MTARSTTLAILKPFAAAVAVMTVLIATPVAGLVGVAAWQRYEPESLRVVMHELSVLTKADDANGVMDNVLAALGPVDGQPG